MCRYKSSSCLTLSPWISQDVLDLVEEEKSESESSSEYEEYTDSEDETGPRLKPVFVPKTDRLSIKEKEKLAKQEQEIEQQKKKQAELRKRESHRVCLEVWVGWKRECTTGCGGFVRVCRW